AVLEAMVAELQRSMQRLKLPGFETPYFIAYTVRDFDSIDIIAKFGALVSDNRTRQRQAYVEVRVGNYQFDNTADAATDGGWDSGNDALYEPGTDLPVDDDPDALRGMLWLLTDARYKSALSALNLKRGHRATTLVEDETVASFAHAPAITLADKVRPLKVDRAAWDGRLRNASAVLKKHTAIFDSSVRFQVSHETRTLVTSEGTRLVTDRTIYGVHISTLSRA